MYAVRRVDDAYGLLDSLNDEFCIADAGLIYVFLCFDCLEGAAVVDSA